MSTVLDNSRITKHLGQVSKYKSTYDSSLLVNEPRSNNRQHINVTEESLPFDGFDTWNAYEVSALTHDGLPVASVAKIVYNCNSKYIVESKSIKLYFNSFNMFKCGHDSEEVNEYIAHRAEHDLSKLLETDVRVDLIPSAVANNIQPQEIFDQKYETLEDTIDLSNITFDTYQETPELLKFQDTQPGTTGKYTQYLHSSLLKSNCRVTSQPDWGDVYIYIKGDYNKTPDKLSVLRHVISFRDECHFHEEICETIYIRLLEKYEPEELCVTCLYARRGGIDINPTRASDPRLLPLVLEDISLLHRKTSKQ